VAIPYRYDHASAFIDGHAVASTCLVGKHPYSCDSARVEILDRKGRTVSEFTFGGYYLKLHDAGDDWYHLNVYDGYSLIVIGKERTPDVILFRDYGGTGALPAFHWPRNGTSVLDISGYDDASRAVCAYRRLAADTLPDTMGAAFHAAYLQCPPSSELYDAPVPDVPKHITESHPKAVRAGKDRYLTVVNGVFHVIDARGRSTSRELFESVGGHLFWRSRYMTIVSQNGMKGLLDNRGRLVLPCDHLGIVKNRDDDIAYTSRIGPVADARRFGWVTGRGRSVPPQFDRVRNAGAGLVCAERDGRAAYFTLNGRQVTPFIYRFFYDTDRAQCGRAVYAELLTDSSESIPVYINKKGKTIWKCNMDYVDR